MASRPCQYMSRARQQIGEEKAVLSHVSFNVEVVSCSRRELAGKRSLGRYVQTCNNGNLNTQIRFDRRKKGLGARRDRNVECAYGLLVLFQRLPFPSSSLPISVSRLFPFRSADHSQHRPACPFSPLAGKRRTHDESAKQMEPRDWLHPRDM